MLMWCCDLIVAARRRLFADVVGTRLGMCGLEYFAHPWEFGPRRPKSSSSPVTRSGSTRPTALGMV